MTTKRLNKVYLAQMKWCEWEEPVCVGTNKRKVMQTALHMLKKEYGTGRVCRGQAMCSVPITMSDVEVVVLPFLSTNNTK